MPADLIVYAVVAAGLVFWLRSVLGTRHGEERERPNPLTPPPSPAQTVGDPARMKEEAESPNPQSRIEELAENPGEVMAIDNKTAENGLLDIARADKGFDIDFFLSAAQDAFVLVVEAFAKGEREILQDLLEPSVYEAFDAAIAERQARNETQETEIHAIRRAEVIEARMEGRKAFVTVRFKADETSVTRDKDGEIIEGHPDKTTSMTDIWTFGRDLKSRDPRWFLYETRGDFDGDNDLIPDAG